MLILDPIDTYTLEQALNQTGLDHIVKVEKVDGQLLIHVPGVDMHALMDELDYRNIPYQCN